MRLFHKENQYCNYNIYSFKKQIDKKKVIINTFISILIILILTICIYYTIDTIIIMKKNKQFVEQVKSYINEIKMQEEAERKKEEERNAKIPQLTEIGKENIKNIYQDETKIAFLTFDDGPSKNTQAILDILNQYNVKATFFVLGSQVEYFPETINRIYDEGHYIANHGYSHKYQEIYKSPENVLNEFNRCNQIVADTIGIPEYNSHLFRFPGGLIGRKI